ncbi:11831_t:CDS:2, partial [Funneliformis geosporum]
IKPKVFIFENVKGLLSHKEIGYAEPMTDEEVKVHRSIPRGQEELFYKNTLIYICFYCVKKRGMLENIILPSGIKDDKKIKEYIKSVEKIAELSKGEDGKTIIKPNPQFFGKGLSSKKEKLVKVAEEKKVDEVMRTVSFEEIVNSLGETKFKTFCSDCKLKLCFNKVDNFAKHQKSFHSKKIDLVSQTVKKEIGIDNILRKEFSIVEKKNSSVLKEKEMIDNFRAERIFYVDAAQTNSKVAWANGAEAYAILKTILYHTLARRPRPSNSHHEELIFKTMKPLITKTFNEKITAYKKKEKQPSQFNQVKSLVKIKEQNPHLKQIFSQVLQNIPKQRIPTIWLNFKKRKENNKRTNLPSAKPLYRYNSFTYPQHGFKLEKGQLILSQGQGYPKLRVNIRLHTQKKRPLPNEIETCSIFRKNVEVQQLSKTGKKVGTDMGLNDFCILDDGTKISIPQFYRKVETQLNELNRIGDRKKHKRDKEDKTRPSKRYLKHKSKVVGKQVVEVNPRNTSKTCFNCKVIKKDLKLKDRIFVCDCGYEADRDINASKNILYKAQTTEQELSPLGKNMTSVSLLELQRRSPHPQTGKS